MTPERYTLQTSDYKNRVYRSFHARRDSVSGPGWFVFGRCLPHAGRDTYGGKVVMLCARPDVPARKHPHYNIRVRRGFRTMREANRVAELLNETYPAGGSPSACEESA